MPKITESFNPSEYALVADRITAFYEKHPNGRIVTELVRDDRDVVFKAAVYRNTEEREPAATGWAKERVGDGDINLVACVENTETSAIGRALANLGFTASLKRPSREEMEKADRARARYRVRPGAGASTATEAPKFVSAADLLTVLTRLELRGFPRTRADIVRRRATAVPPLPQQRVVEIERKLRDWAYRHRAPASTRM